MSNTIKVEQVMPKQPPVPTEIVRWTHASQAEEVAAWIDGSIGETQDGKVCVMIKTPIGPINCVVGSNIVKHPNGLVTLITDKMLRFQYADYTESVIDGGVHGLDYMLELQRQVENTWGRLPDPSDGKAVSQYIREVVLCATDELHEALAEVNWKPWKTNYGIKNLENYRGELADVLHFVLDLYLAAGLTGEDIINDYVAKHDENLVRRNDQAYLEK